MAKIKFGMMMTDARGKLGGQVFSKNRSGSYVRTKVTPVNPQTEFQQANRSILGSISSGWSGLSESQRDAWNSQTVNWEKTNVFGDLNKPTGKNLFTSLNKNRQQFYPELPQLDVPPAKFEFGSFSISSVTYNTTSSVMVVNFASEVSNERRFVVRATPVLSAGTSYVKNQLRNLGVATAVNVSGELIIGPAYISRFGNLTTGQNVWVEVRESAENGQTSVAVLFQVSYVS